MHYTEEHFKNTKQQCKRFICATFPKQLKVTKVLLPRKSLKRRTSNSQWHYQYKLLSAPLKTLVPPFQNAEKRKVLQWARITANITCSDVTKNLTILTSAAKDHRDQTNAYIDPAPSPRLTLNTTLRALHLTDAITKVKCIQSKPWLTLHVIVSNQSGRQLSKMLKRSELQALESNAQLAENIVSSCPSLRSIMKVLGTFSHEYLAWNAQTLNAWWCPSVRSFRMYSAPLMLNTPKSISRSNIFAKKVAISGTNPTRGMLLMYVFINRNEGLGACCRRNHGTREERPARF